MAGRILSLVEGEVAFVAIENEARRNALDSGMWGDLQACIEDLSANAALRCILLRGDGEVAFSDASDRPDDRDDAAVSTCLAAMLDCDIPIVARLRGACMGGGLTLACAADIRLADESARFGVGDGPLAFAEVRSLYARAGSTVAAELLLEGRILNAVEAVERRLVTRLCPAETLDHDVAECLWTLRQMDRAILRNRKRQLRHLVQDPLPVPPDAWKASYAVKEADEPLARLPFSTA